MIDGSALDERVKQLALAIFAALAQAEGRVHGVAPDDVRFHEVGAIDSIVDIVGAAVGFAHFQVQRFTVGTIPVGSGIVRSQHGPIPVPAPATAELLAGFALRLGDGDGELVTPTGAAILAALATPTEGAGGDTMRIQQVGYGAGTKVFADRPNLLRLLLGENVAAVGRDEIVAIEATIDDATPEILAYAMERLLAAGARDVYLTPVVMKKGRAATLLSVLAEPVDRERLVAMITAETTAIGVRYATMRRTVLPRAERAVETKYGSVRVKVATAADGTSNVAPEFEDCRRLASERGVPLKWVYQAAIAAALSG